MPREMPAKGFYVYENVLTGQNVDVVYTTGQRGGADHKYYRVMGGVIWGWSKLLWTCVPCIKKMQEHYTFYPELPPGIPELPS